MCFAILEITYKGETGKKELLTIATEAELDRRIKEKSGNDMIQRIGVFKKTHDVLRHEEWRTVMYNPPKVEEAAA